jgi:hypothetical protein
MEFEGVQRMEKDQSRESDTKGWNVPYNSLRRISKQRYEIVLEIIVEHR